MPDALSTSAPRRTAPQPPGDCTAPTTAPGRWSANRIRPLGPEPSVPSRNAGSPWGDRYALLCSSSTRLTLCLPDRPKNRAESLPRPYKYQWSNPPCRDLGSARHSAASPSIESGGSMGSSSNMVISSGAMAAKKSGRVWISRRVGMPTAEAELNWYPTEPQSPHPCIAEFMKSSPRHPVRRHPRRSRPIHLRPGRGGRLSRYDPTLGAGLCHRHCHDRTAGGAPCPPRAHASTTWVAPWAPPSWLGRPPSRKPLKLRDYRHRQVRSHDHRVSGRPWIANCPRRDIALEYAGHHRAQITYSNASVCILNYTLQFIAIDQRLALVGGAAGERWTPGDVLILSEKIELQPASMNRPDD